MTFRTIELRDSNGDLVCIACDGTGDLPLMNGGSEPCSACNGTGIYTTGEVAGTPESHGFAFNLDDARDRIERRDAKIAEQAAEIERLKAERDTHLCPLCHGTGMTGNVNDREACERCEGTGIDAYTEMIAELTTNRYAALEAERDALKLEVEEQRMLRSGERLKKNEARARAEKYLRVIEAKDATLHALLKLHNAAMHSASITASAGLPVYYSETREKESHE